MSSTPHSWPIEPAARASRWRAVASVIPSAAYALFVLVLVSATQSGDFLTVRNVVNIGIQSSVLLMLALPLTLIVMSEGLDLSQGALLSLASVALASVLAHAGSVESAVLASIGVGALFGAFNGALIAYLRLPPFVVTLGSMGLAHGIALVVTDGESVTEIGTRLPALYNATVLGVPFAIVVAMAMFGIFHYVHRHTRFGSYVSALGGNRDALRLAGIHAARYLWLVYAAGGAMVGLVALLWVGRINAGHPTAGIGLEFDALVAVLLGGTRLDQGRGTMVGTLIGVLAVGVLRNGLNLAGVPPAWQAISLGFLVLATLWVEAHQEER